MSDVLRRLKNPTDVDTRSQAGEIYQIRHLIQNPDGLPLRNHYSSPKNIANLREPSMLPQSNLNVLRPVRFQSEGFSGHHQDLRGHMDSVFQYGRKQENIYIP